MLLLIAVGSLRVILPKYLVYPLLVPFTFSKVYSLLSNSILSTSTLTTVFLICIGQTKSNTYCEPDPINDATSSTSVNKNLLVVLSNLTPVLIVLGSPSPRTTLSFASLPLSPNDPLTSSVGALRYPLPLLVTSTAVIF